MSILNLTINPSQILTFQKMLTPTLIEIDSAGKNILRYEMHHEHGVKDDRGVYVVTVNGTPVYCGKYTKTFNRRWLYARHNHIYHFKKNHIAEQVQAGHLVCVYAQTEKNLKSQIGIDSAWIDVNSIESNILKNIPMDWNLTAA